MNQSCVPKIGRMREKRENVMLSPVTEEISMKFGESKRIRAEVVVRSEGVNRKME